MYGDIIEAVVQAFCRGGVPCSGAGELAERMTALQFTGGRIGYDSQGRQLFGTYGNRLRGVGEYVVCVRPRFVGRRVLSDGTSVREESDAGPSSDFVIERALPEATIEVWAWVPGSGGPAWQRKGRMIVPYYDGPREGG
jgi:hypothetical protein